MNFQNLNLERLGAMVPHSNCSDIDALAIVKKYGIPHTRRGGTYFIDVESVRRIWANLRKERPR